jgi:hypothetical protein
VSRLERPLRIVRVRRRRAKEGVDGVTDILFHRATLGGDDRAQLAEGSVEGTLQSLRAQRHRERCGPHDVNEHGRNDASLGEPLTHG